MSVSPIWPAGSAVNDEGEITFHGRTAASLLDEHISMPWPDAVKAKLESFLPAAA